MHFIASNERRLYDGVKDDGRNARSLDAQAESIRQSTLDLEASQRPQRDLLNDLEGARIPAEGTFLSLLNVKILMERIKHDIALKKQHQ